MEKGSPQTWRRNGPSALSCRSLSIRIPGRGLVESLDLDVAHGEFVAVLGRNGSGKTLSLHTLAGLRARTSGRIDIGGHSLDSLKRRQLARRLALLPQHADDAFPATVLETILIGRHPHIGPVSRESSEDRRIALRALEQVDLAGFAGRDIGTLSGGERQRVAIAQVLTQAPEIYLLDEPTNHLDPQHQLDVLRLFHEQAGNGAAVLATLHDVNLAVRYADRCLLLFGDGRWALGETASILGEETLSTLFATRMEAVRWHERDIFMAT